MDKENILKLDKSLFIESISQKLIVSRETMEKLIFFSESLIEYTQTHNLIAKSTIPTIATRHILDSAQLQKYIPPMTESIIDLGSGAGFPGIVLSILGIKNVNLVESTTKKAAFLEFMIKELNLSAAVHNKRIEAIKDIKADIITARALTDLNGLISFSKQLLNKDGFCLFMKGQSHEAELTGAEKYWTFDYEKLKSETDALGIILKIKNIHQKKSHGKRRSQTKKQPNNGSAPE